MKTRIATFISSILVVALCSLSPVALGAALYDITNIGGYLPGTNSYAHGINANGDIVGFWYGPDGAHAFLYRGGVASDLGPIGAANHFALSINSLGQIVGFSQISNRADAFLFDGQLKSLGTFGADESYALNINSAGEIVGFVNANGQAHAFLLNGNGLRDLGSLGGTNSYAFSINNFSQVAGASLNEQNLANAFVWQNGSLANLNTTVSLSQGWVLEEARAMNDRGHIAGSGLHNGQERGFLLRNNLLIDLGVLPGGTNSYALALNSAAIVVGVSSTDGPRKHAFVWNESMADLNQLISAAEGWELREARGINDSGQIVGWGVLNGQEQAFLLTPRPSSDLAPTVPKKPSRGQGLSTAKSLSPSVSITSPTNNSNFTAPANVTINANASDSDGTVTQVQFFAGSLLLGIDTSNPYSCTWSNVPLGTFSLTARATDSSGDSATSSVVTISVSTNLTDVADAHVRDGSWASTNFGSSTNLEVQFANGSGNNRDAYLLFNLSSMNNISSAKLKIAARVSPAASIVTTVYSTATNWTENGITWNNKASLSNSLGTVTINTTTNAFYLIDVSSYIKTEKAAGRNLVALALHDTSKTTSTVLINSKEAAIDPPRLVIDVTNVAPSVSITTPANGSYFTPPANISISASASDNDGTISQVEFFQGNTSLGVITTPPYSLTWSNVSTGSYSLTARAIDNAGAISTSAVVTVIADTPPSVSITAPANDASFFGPTNILLTATASDSDGTISQVEFFQGATSVGVKASSPYEVSWSNVTAGAYALTARATDNVGRLATSAVVNITVLTPPIITVQPQNVFVGAGSNAVLTVTASGTAPLSYQWYFNGIGMRGKVGASLTIENAQLPNAGAYTVVVSNPYGSVTSTPAVVSVGIIVGWGSNGSGQISLLPWMTNNIVSISAWGSHNAALISDGTVRMWGDTNGNNTPPAGLVSAVAVSCGASHTLALKSDGTVLVWGSNASGQTNVPASATNIVAVAAGANHNLGLRANGTVVAWGQTNSGQATVPAGLSNVMAIAAGNVSSMALQSNGAVIVWGDSSLTNVPGGLNDIIAMASGKEDSFCLVVHSNGTVAGWGDNSHGALNIPGNLAGVTAMAAGRRHSVALRSNGTVAAWGGNPANQFDDAYAGQATVPAGLVGAKDIDGGDFHSLALLTNDANLWPNISITSPSNNSTSSVPTNITISATATDWDGTVASVSFYANGELIGTDATGPYSLVWSNVPAGLYTLTAVATDNQSASKISSPVIITVNSVVSPLADAHVRDASPTVNFGTSTNLELQAGTTGSNREAYLKFDLSTVPSVTSAKLRLFAALSSSGSATTRVYSVTDTTWNETNITWNNKPSQGSSALATNTVTSTTFSWIEFDVTSYLQSEKSAGRDTVSVALHNPTASTRFIKANSREAAANQPQLVLYNSNKRPSVSITAPTNGFIVSAPATIVLSAVALDSDGTVSKVEFFQGSTSLGTSASPPYGLNWSNVAAGSYSLTARATDNLGATRTSAAIAVRVDNPPSVSITSPTNGSRAVEFATITLTASASDSDGAVTKVEYFDGAEKIGESTNTPYSVSWQNVWAGSHSIIAVATDDSGSIGSSDPVTITIFPGAADLGPMRLGFWRFEDTNWFGDQGQAPLLATNLQSITDAGNNVVAIDTNAVSNLKYRAVEDTKVPNVDLAHGSVLFRWKSGWTSAGSGGSGPGTTGQLISFGKLTSDASYGYWGLFVSSDGSLLQFVTQSNGASVTNLSVSVNWDSNTWHQIGLTYSESNSSLYIDCQPVLNNGTGISLLPSEVIRAADGLNLGSDPNGNSQAHGRFDNLETFNYVLSASDIAGRLDSDGDGLPDSWEVFYGLDPFSALGSDGAGGDPDGDGLDNFTEFIEGRNPVSGAVTNPGLISLRVFTPLK